MSKDRNKAEDVQAQPQPHVQYELGAIEDDLDDDTLTGEEEEAEEEVYDEEETTCDVDIEMEGMDGEVEENSTSSPTSDESDSVDIEGGDNEVESTCESATPAATSRTKSIQPKVHIKLNTLPSPSVSKLSALSLNIKKMKKRRESGTSSDEERWLTAIESGKLEDVDDELKKIKDPKLMTARQRAMYERNLDTDFLPDSELLMALPNGYREKEKPQTAEDIQKAALKSQKRKQQADEKREKDKKKTMERLLKKQENKQRTSGRKLGSKMSTPMLSYRNTITGSYILMPPQYDFPLKAQTAPAPPGVKLCGIADCAQPKKYSCSKTKLPLCSLECYRKNVQNIKKIIN